MLGFFVGGALLLVAVVLTGVLAADVALDLAQVGILELGHEAGREDAAGNGHERHREKHDDRAHNARPAGVMGTKSP